MNVPENIKEYIGDVSVGDLILCLTGSLLLGCWLLRTSLGTRALDNSAARRNNMPLFLPFLLLFVSYFSVALGGLIATWLVGDLQGSQGVVLDNLVICITGLASIVIIIVTVRPFFVRRLKGFGLNFRTIYKDLPAAFLNLLTIWPLITLALVATIYLGQLFYGRDYKMPVHQGLETITENPQLPPRIMVTIAAVLVIPVLEELLFRGLFQTMIRSLIFNRRARSDRSETIISSANPAVSAVNSSAGWPAIAISSALFIMMHADVPHWPALYVLGVGMGYAYEKSGSLFRPIFIHVLFNAISVISVWVQ